MSPPLAGEVSDQSEARILSVTANENSCFQMSPVTKGRGGAGGPGPVYKRCHLCVRIFSTKANLSSHIRHVHMGEAKHSRVKSIPCPHCNKMFSRKVRVLTKSTEMSILTMFLLLQGHMTEHVRTVHEGKKRIYKEVNCQVSFLIS